jgi:hypothetical protein
MSENKTKPTGASVDAYIASRATEQQRLDCNELMTMLTELTHQKPRMWGPSIVGYGSCEYISKSGLTGEVPVIGFAIRGREIVIYLSCEGEMQAELLSKLGKHRVSKACLYFRKLSDLDKSILEKLILRSITSERQNS